MGAFKDEIGAAAVDRIAAAFHAVDPAFPHSDFIAMAKQGLDDLELKARVQHLAHCLHASFDAGYGQDAESSWVRRLESMQAALDQGITGFVAWPIIDSVALFGRNRAAESVPALAAMTSAFTAEFAIRPFLVDDPEGTLATMLGWTESEEEHVRRLASEGSRPVLPWGIALPRLKQEPARSRPILEALRFDSAAYVRKSVANHMNDHAREHPEYVLRTIAEWGGLELPWAKHALRTLIKRGHPGVWPLLGMDPETPVTIGLDQAPSRVAMGEDLCFTLTLRNPGATEQRVMLDYQVHFVRARGPRSIKVFKLREFRLAPGESRTIEKRHSFRPVTTRRDYPGEHRMVLQLNGRETVGFDFELTEG